MKCIAIDPETGKGRYHWCFRVCVRVYTGVIIGTCVQEYNTSRIARRMCGIRFFFSSSFLVFFTKKSRLLSNAWRSVWKLSANKMWKMRNKRVQTYSNGFAKILGLLKLCNGLHYICVPTPHNTIRYQYWVLTIKYLHTLFEKHVFYFYFQRLFILNNKCLT